MELAILIVKPVKDLVMQTVHHVNQNINIYNQEIVSMIVLKKDLLKWNQLKYVLNIVQLKIY